MGEKVTVKKKIQRDEAFQIPIWLKNLCLSLEKSCNYTQQETTIPEPSGGNTAGNGAVLCH